MKCASCNNQNCKAEIIAYIPYYSKFCVFLEESQGRKLKVLDQQVKSLRNKITESEKSKIYSTVSEVVIIEDKT